MSKVKRKSWRKKEPKQQVNLFMGERMMQILTQEADRIGVTRSQLILLWLDERIARESKDPSWRQWHNDRNEEIKKQTDDW